MSNQRFVKDVGILGITQILISLSSFLLVPIITKALGAYDYGIWSQINVTVSLLMPLVLLGLSMAFVRFFSSKTNKLEIREGFFSIFLFVTFISVVISLILLFLSTRISYFLFSDVSYTFLFNISLSLIILGALNTITLYYFRIYQQIWTFTGISIFRSIGRIALTVLLLNVGYGLFGVIVAAVIAEVVPIIFSLISIIKQIGFSVPSFKNMREYLRFSIPLTPNGLIYWITNSSDRYVIQYFLGTVSVGIYSASYGIGSLVFLLVSPLQMILFPQLSKLYDLGDLPAVKSYLSYSLKFFLLVALPAVVGLTVLSNSLLLLLTTAEFTSGYLVIPLVALSAVFNGIVQILSNIIFIFKETKFSFYITGIAALFNIIFNILMIPLIGFIAAAISTLLSFVIMFILCFLKTVKYIEIKMEFIFLLKIVLSSIVMGVIVYISSINNMYISIILGIFIYFLLIFLLKTFNKNELSYFTSYLKNILKGGKFFD
jgi:O-antigen/teichoic acid export membrane protein